MRRLALIAVLLAVATLVGCDPSNPDGRRPGPDAGAGGDDADLLTNGISVKMDTVVAGSGGDPDSWFTDDGLVIRRDEGGRLLVLSLTDGLIRVFDAKGRGVATIGRPGKGPGDLAVPVAMGLAANGHIWVAEAAAGRYSVFDSAGEFLRVVPRPAMSSVRWVHPLVSLGDSGLVDEGSRPDRQVGFYRVGVPRGTVDTLPAIQRVHPFRKSLSLPPGALERTADFLPRTLWTVTRGGVVWIADARGHQIVKRSLGGEPLCVIPTPHREENLTATERAEVLRELRAADVSEDDVVLVKRTVRGIWPLGDGPLLVMLEEEGTGRSTFDLYGHGGRHLGSLGVPIRLSHMGIPAIHGDTVWAVALSDLDVPFIVRLEFMFDSIDGVGGVTCEQERSLRP